MQLRTLHNILQGCSAKKEVWERRSVPMRSQPNTPLILVKAEL